MQLTTKRFVLRKSLIGKDAQITVEFKNGKEVNMFPRGMITTHTYGFDLQWL